jgi:hypothetical protein
VIYLSGFHPTRKIKRAQQNFVYHRPSMKFVKRAILSILILHMVGILFRGWLYRHLITYHSVGPRTIYPATDAKLIDFINANLEGQTVVDIKQIIKLSLSITSTQLSFTSGQNEVDPNKLIRSRTAHCVGYASFFATTCNYLLDQYNLADSWQAKPHAGQLYFLGNNIHSYFNSPFFKDHDFVTIENKTTGEILAVDPTVNDYLYIDFITYSE